MEQSKNERKKGYFIPIRVNYKSKTAEEQAEEILRIVSTCYYETGRQVGITYSADAPQTNRIGETYKQVNGWKTGIKGSNQAAVMQAIERLLESEYTELQGVFRILPITTCEFPKDANPLLEIIKDLNEIENFLKYGNIVLGWKNETSGEKYAVGGGHVTLTPQIDSHIQRKLTDCSTAFPATNASFDLNQNSISENNEEIRLLQDKISKTRNKELSLEEALPEVEWNKHNSQVTKELYKSLNKPEDRAQKSLLRRYVQAETIDYLIKTGSINPEPARLYQYQGNITLPSTRYQCQIKVVEQDSIETALELVKVGKDPTMLNMANRKRVGGYWKEGGIAQEETIWLLTNLGYSLPKQYSLHDKQNPDAGAFGEFDAYYSKRIKVVRAGSETGYQFLNSDEQFWINIISSAAYDMNESKYKGAKPDTALFNEYYINTKKKIEQQFIVAIKEGKKHLVLSAFGCGAFKNDPNVIAKIYQEVITEYKDYFESITFSILPTPGKKNTNFEAFKKVFETPIISIAKETSRLYRNSPKCINQMKKLLKCEFNAKGLSFSFPPEKMDECRMMQKKLSIHGTKYQYVVETSIEAKVQGATISISDSDSIRQYVCEVLKLPIGCLDQLYNQSQLPNPLGQIREQLCGGIKELVRSLNSATGPGFFYDMFSNRGDKIIVLLRLTDAIRINYNGKNLEDLISVVTKTFSSVKDCSELKQLKEIEMNYFSSIYGFGY